MNRILLLVLGMVGILILVVIAIILITPWMDRWGATDDEIASVFLGDELLPHPAQVVNRAITIHAPADQIYPWILQLGADKGGMYSYTWLESLLNCKQVNADRIHPEWQNLQVGDLVRMCPENTGPVPFTVAALGPLYTVVLGHQENGSWVELWQFVIEPLPNPSSRLILRTRTNMTGGIWSIIHPCVFVMERGMLLGIKDRAEALARQ